MIRVYLSTWELRYAISGDEDSRFIWHPIPEAVGQLPELPPGTPRDQRVRWFAEYPDADSDGQPDGPSVLVFVAGPDIPDSIAALPEVTQLPPFDLSDLVENMDPVVVADVITAIGRHGIPYPTVAGVRTAGELLDRILGQFRVGAASVTARFAGRGSEFA